MFSLKLFRLKPFNRKLVSNLIKSNAINARLVSNSVGFGHNPEPIDRSSSRITDPKNWADRQSRKEMLFEIFVMSCNVSKNNKRITELINENDLEALCDSAEAAIDDMFNRELINCLHSFLAMGLDPNSKIVRNSFAISIYLEFFTDPKSGESVAVESEEVYTQGIVGMSVVSLQISIN